MGHEELSRKLTGMAADVVRDCHVELALGWLWSNKSRDPLPAGAARSVRHVDVRPRSGLAGSGSRLHGPRLLRGLPASGFSQLAERRGTQGPKRQCGTGGTPEPDCWARAVSGPGLSGRPKAVIVPLDINVVPDCRVHACCLSLLSAQPHAVTGSRQVRGVARRAAMRLPPRRTRETFAGGRLLVRILFWSDLPLLR